VNFLSVTFPFPLMSDFLWQHDFATYSTVPQVVISRVQDAMFCSGGQKK
jgi:hypothetical protein